MSFESSSNEIFQSWNLQGKTIKACIENEKLYFFIEHENKISLISNMNISGIPLEISKNVSKLKSFLSDTYIKLNKLDDGDYKLYINQRLRGGGNTIDPVSEPHRLWPNAIIPYKIDSKKYPIGEKERKIIKDAISKWNNANTGFRLIEQTKETDYLIFGEDENTCWSNVGRIGGEQYTRCDLDGNVGFNKGSIMHEIGHVIGLHHEHKRKDRDDFFDVTSRNKANYGKEGRSHGNMDFDSLMMYRKNNDLKLKPNYQNIEIGQRDHISDGDIAAVKYLATFAKDPDTFKKYAKELQNQNNSEEAIKYFEISNDVSLKQKRKNDWDCLYQKAIEQLKLEKIDDAKITLTFIKDNADKYNPEDAKLIKLAIHEIKKINDSEKKVNMRIQNYRSSHQRDGRTQNEVQLSSYILGQAIFQNNYSPTFYQPKTKYEILREKAEEFFKRKDYYESYRLYEQLFNMYDSYDLVCNDAESHDKFGMCASKTGDNYMALEQHNIASRIDPYNDRYKRHITFIEKKIEETENSYSYWNIFMCGS